MNYYIVCYRQYERGRRSLKTAYVTAGTLAFARLVAWASLPYWGAPLGSVVYVREAV